MCGPLGEQQPRQADHLFGSEFAVCVSVSTVDDRRSEDKAFFWTREGGRETIAYSELHFSRRFYTGEDYKCRTGGKVATNYSGKLGFLLTHSRIVKFST